MEQLEFKYKTEIGKNASLLRMNSSLMNKNDILNRCLYSIHLLFYSSQRLYSPEHQFEEDELEYLLELVKKQKQTERDHQCVNCEELQQQIERLKRNGTAQNEERWKTLYNKQAEETYRLSKVNAQLMESIKQFTINRNKNEEELKLFLEEYLQIFEKVNIIDLNSIYHTNPNNIDNNNIEQGLICQQTVRQNSTTKKKQRSTSFKKSSKSKQKKYKIDKQKTVLFSQNKQISQKVNKQWNMLNKLRQSAIQQTEAIRRQLVQVLKTLKQSEDNTRYLRNSLRQSIKSL